LPNAWVAVKPVLHSFQCGPDAAACSLLSTAAIAADESCSSSDKARENPVLRAKLFVPLAAVQLAMLRCDAKLRYGRSGPLWG